ncbi:MAG TPA: hypothetical protein VJ898_16440, partial [Natrialbaceae archaeon]|nr:hypothetical protein [Natrialbaceae archaeon]
MSGEIEHILLFFVFMGLLSVPQYQPYNLTFIAAVGFLLRGVIVAARNIQEVARLVKVDLQSKSLSLVVFVSTLTPRIGSYLQKQDYALSYLKRRFESKVGDPMLEFRRDLRRIYVDEFETPEDPEEKIELLHKIKKIRIHIRRRHSIGEFVIGISGSILAVILGQFSALGGLLFLLSVYLIVFPISTALRSVIVDTLAFSGELVQGDDDRIWPPKRRAVFRFQWQWNKMLLENEAIIHKMIL